MGTALSEELANAQMVQEVKAKACVCTHWDKSHCHAKTSMVRYWSPLSYLAGRG